MPDLSAPDYRFARFVIERGLGLLYLVAFVVAANQFPALCGERGLDPARRYLNARGFWQLPSLFHLGYSDRAARDRRLDGRRHRRADRPRPPAAGAAAGHDARLARPLGPLPVDRQHRRHASTASAGRRSCCEAGFLAIFLGNAETAPPWPVLFAFRWLAFRVEFGAGLIKLRGDPCWRDLTCMDCHHETQPMPNPLSWFFHHLPRPLHRLEVVGNFVAQLVLPFGLVRCRSRSRRSAALG